MSDENLPKLRLKPKLTPAPTEPAVSPAPAAAPGPATSTPTGVPESAPVAPSPAEPSAPGATLVPPATAEAPRFVRLKPRLSAPPPAPAEASNPEPASRQQSSPTPENPSAPASDGGAATEAPVTRFTLRPRPPGAEPAAVPLTQDDSVPPLLTPPAGEFSPALNPNETGEQGVVTPLTMPARLSPLAGPAEGGGQSLGEGMPVTGAFPPPPGKFTGLTPQPLLSPLPVKPKKSRGAVKWVVAVGVFALLAGGGYFVYAFYLAVPPPPEPGPRLLAKPKIAPVAPVAATKSVAELAAARAAEVDARTREAEGLPPATAAVEQGVPAVTTPPPPPPPPAPSVPFKAWVENLHISGLRAGAEPKIFVGGAAYLVGDLINPQLGITFEGYNAETRMLIFKDKTGAIVEKRN